MDALLEILHDAKPEVRYSAATALGRIGMDSDRAVQMLINALKKSDDDIKMYVVLPSANPERKLKKLFPF